MSRATHVAAFCAGAILATATFAVAVPKDVSRFRAFDAFAQALALVENNYVGKVRDGALGSSLKDRSASTLIRNNYIDCSARCIDLVEPQEHWPMVNEAAYREQQADLGQPVDPVDLANVRAAEQLFRNNPVQIYGNTVRTLGDAGAAAMFHFGFFMKGDPS